MEKIIKENKRLKIGTYLTAFISILLILCTIYFTPESVANNLSSDGILEQTTIFQINFIRISFSILGTIGLLIIGLYIVKPNLFYLLQLKISKILPNTNLLGSKGSVRERREKILESETRSNADYFYLNLSIFKIKITKSLISIVILLHVASAFAVWLQHNVSKCFLRDFYIDLFWVVGEGKIPTWYSACALIFCALLLFAIAFLKRKSLDPYFWNWVGLATIFVYMSLDEATRIHEVISAVLNGTFNTTGIFYYAWVIPGIFFVLIFGIMYLKFTLDLQKRTRYLFMAAFFIFVGGALGLEMVGSAYIYKYKFSLTYNIIGTIEELLEMSGIVIFIYALIDYIEVCLGSKEIRLGFSNQFRSTRNSYI